MSSISVREYSDRVLSQCEKVIVGKREVIEKVLICFLCSGHILLQDVPGTGKTMLLRAFAATVGGSFKRVQFTPDLLPGDLTGINFYNQKTGEFQFRPGPVFANLVLADEINRATPRTQSALLEAMAERQVTVDGETHAMAEPFMIMATQNPLESHGTFPLPEAQTDRFFMRLSLGYMERDQELRVLTGTDTNEIVASLSPRVSAEDTAAVKQAVAAVEVAPEVAAYLMELVAATREDSRIRIGVSTRGALALYHAAQAAAALAGRDYFQPEDIKALAPSVLAHRIVMAVGGKMSESEALIRELAALCKVPTEAH
jgi:MoxR-like ATPase